MATGFPDVDYNDPEAVERFIEESADLTFNMFQEQRDNPDTLKLVSRMFAIEQVVHLYAIETGYEDLPGPLQELVFEEQVALGLLLGLDDAGVVLRLSRLRDRTSQARNSSETSSANIEG